jgi:hypothetical protein
MGSPEQAYQRLIDGPNLRWFVRSRAPADRMPSSRGSPEAASGIDTIKQKDVRPVGR